jgi:dTDP-4-dehydrorhamnose reductase
MRVLVTGSTGLLGTSLTSVLESRGFSVLRHSRTRGELAADLTVPESVSVLLQTTRPDVVVNLAALTDVDRCESHPHEAYLLNTRVVENLAAMAGSGLVPYLVHVSTDQVYDGAGPHGEESVTISNYYAFSKYAGELAAARARGAILRTNFFGRSAQPHRRSFSDWIVGALSREEPVQVFEDVLFSPLSIERLTALICAVIEKRLEGTFNLGSLEGMSKADFCYRLAHTLGLPTRSMARAKSTDKALRAYRPKDMRMDCARFAGACGVELPTLEQEIASMKRYYHVNS